MAIVFTTDPKWFGIKKVIAGAGEVLPSKEDGTFEIADEHLDEVLELYSDIHLFSEAAQAANKKPAEDENEEEEQETIGGEEVGGDSIQKNEQDDLNIEPSEQIIGDATNVSTEANDAPVETVNEPTADDAADEEKKKAMLAALDEKTLKELQDLAKAFPYKEWGTKNKKELLEFLKAKLA